METWGCEPCAAAVSEHGRGKIGDGAKPAGSAGRRVGGWTLGVASDTDQSSLICSSGNRRGVVGFKGCSPASSYPKQVSYLVSPPGLSIASYSRVCRTYLCNNLTNLNPLLKLKAKAPKTTAFASHSCPTCVGEHSQDCLPNFVTTDSCPYNAPKCYSSTLSFRAGERRETFFIKYLLYARYCLVPSHL